MKNKILSICLVATLCLYSVVPTFASEQTVEFIDTSAKSVGSTISKDTLQCLIDKYSIDVIDGYPDMESVCSMVSMRDEINMKLKAMNEDSAYSLLSDSAHNESYEFLTNELATVEDDLSKIGVTRITPDDLRMLLGASTAASTTTYPHDPPDTSYVTFSLLTGQSEGIYYFTILATSNHYDSTYAQASHPLYNCHVTSCIKNKAVIGNWVLSESLDMLLSAGTGAYESAGYGSIPGIYSFLLGSIFEEAVTNGQSFDANITVTLSQTMAYTYASYDESSYYAHILSTQRMAIKPRYTIGGTIGGEIKDETFVSDSFFAVTPYFNNVSTAIERFSSGDSSLYAYSIGNLTLRYYSYADGTLHTKSLPYTYYSEPQSIPGYI